MGPCRLGLPAGPPLTAPDRRSDAPAWVDGDDDDDDEEIVEESDECSHSCCSASSGVILVEGSHLQHPVEIK